MRNFGLFGILSFISGMLYIFVGATFIPDFSHINNTVSEMGVLVRDDYKIVLSALSGSLIVFLLLYGSGMLLRVKHAKPAFTVQAIIILIASISGILLVFFPTDLPGEERTLTGWIHFILAISLVIFLTASSFSGFFTFSDFKWMKAFSFIVGVVAIVFTIITSVFVQKDFSTGVGITERVAFISVFLWLFVSGLFYLKNRDIFDKQKSSS